MEIEVVKLAFILFLLGRRGFALFALDCQVY